MQAFVGTGILFIPNGFRSAGMAGAGTLMIFSGCLTTYCILLLCETKAFLVQKHQHPVIGYGGIALLSVGARGKFMVDAATIVGQTGFGCVYFTFIADNMSTMYNFGFDSTSTAGKLLWMLICVLIFTLMSWVRRLSYYTTSNLLAFLAILFTVLLITCVDVYAITQNGTGKNVSWGLSSGILSFFGTSVYAFEGVAMVPFIQEDMKDKEYFTSLMVSCMAGIVITYTFIGGFSYCTFGDETNVIVLQNLDSIADVPAWHTVVRGELVLYCLIAICTYPIVMVPPIKITERMLFRNTEGPLERKSGYKWTKNCWRTFLVFTCGAFAAATSSALDHVVSIIGAVACVPLAFTFPAWFHLRTVGEECGGWRKAVDYAILAFGGVGSLVSLVFAVAEWAGHPITLPI